LAVFFRTEVFFLRRSVKIMKTHFLRFSKGNSITMVKNRLRHRSI